MSSKPDPTKLGGTWFNLFFFNMILLQLSAVYVTQEGNEDNEAYDFFFWTLLLSTLMANVLLLVPYTLSLTHRYDFVGFGGPNRHGFASTGLKRYVGTARLGSTESPAARAARAAPHEACLKRKTNRQRK